MLINIIVGCSLIISFGFVMLWCINPELRKRIEAPKFDFQNKVNSFNDEMNNHHGQQK